MALCEKYDKVQILLEEKDFLRIQPEIKPWFMFL